MKQVRSCHVPGVLSVAAAVAAMLAAAVSLPAADSDLSSSVVGPAVVGTGGTGTYTVTYANAGPDEALSAYCDLVFPAGVPAPFDQITDDQTNFIISSAVDDGGNVPLLFSTVGCDALLIQNQGPGGTGSDPLQNMTAGASHSFSVTTEFPLSATMLASGLRIDGPPAIAGDVTRLGHGTCTDCENAAATCFGGPLASYDLGSLPVELVDDGSANPSYGCNPFTVTAGAIALIDRGSCAFGDKVYNADLAGAAGAIIANSDECLGLPPSPDCVIDMLPGTNGLLASIPAVLVSQNQGLAIKDELLNGPVMVTLGGIPTTDAVFTSNMFLASVADSDPDHGNDGTAWTTALEVFPILDDGFETGDTSAWSATFP